MYLSVCLCVCVCVCAWLRKYVVLLVGIGVRRLSFPKGSSGTRHHSTFLPASSATPVHSHGPIMSDTGRREDGSPLALGDLTLGLHGEPPAPDDLSWHDVEAYARHYGGGDHSALDPVLEGDHWVPTEAVDVAASFKRKHLSHVPPLLIREFLIQLNNVWRSRLHSQLSAIKERYVTQIKEMKRLLSQRGSYREVVQQAEIARLTKDLDTSRRSKVTTRTRSSSQSRSEVSPTCPLLLVLVVKGTFCLLVSSLLLSSPPSFRVPSLLLNRTRALVPLSFLALFPSHRSVSRRVATRGLGGAVA